MKIIRCIDSEYQTIAIREYKLLKKLNHKKIIRMSDCYLNQGRETIYMVMELVQGQTLKKYVKNYWKNRETKGISPKILNGENSNSSAGGNGKYQIQGLPENVAAQIIK